MVVISFLLIPFQYVHIMQIFQRCNVLDMLDRYLKLIQFKVKFKCIRHHTTKITLTDPSQSLRYCS